MVAYFEGQAVAFKLGSETYQLRVLGQGLQRLPPVYLIHCPLLLPLSVSLPLPSLWPRPPVSQCPLHAGLAPLSSTRGREGGCPRNQRTVSALFQRISKAAGGEAGDLLCRVVKKKKSYKTQNLEIDAERPVNPPRPGLARAAVILARGGETEGWWHPAPCCSTA